jgi:hypothetical protein
MAAAPYPAYKTVGIMPTRTPDKRSAIKTAGIMPIRRPDKRSAIRH